MRDKEDAARSAGQMVDKPALSQRTMSQLEDHAAAVDELHEEIDRCHQTIENLTKSTAFLRRQLADSKRR